MTSSDISTCRDLFRNHANSALFVTSQLRPRELKMADGLRRLGWKVGLIYYQWTPFEPHAYFDSCIAVESASEAHEVAMQLSPRICHVFSGAIDDLVLTFCRHKPSPVVIDLNDVFAPSLFDYCHERFEPTREALALADGFCARDLQVKSAERADGFKLPQRLIFFPEYCWNTMAVSEQVKQRAKSDEIHVVSVGTFSLETQGMYDSCYLKLANMMIEQGIHFHIYPHWAYRRDHSGSPHAKFEQDFAEFIALQEKNPYLHLHDSLSIEDLAKVLPQYDFGIVSGGAAEFGQKLGFYYPAYLDTCYSGRISDYLDAHLPVLINDEVKFDYWLLKRYGICIDLKGVLAPGFRDKLLELKRDPRQRQVMGRAAHTLSVSANAPRLAAYYQGVIAAGIAALAVPPAPTFEPQADTAAPVDAAPAFAQAPSHPVAAPIAQTGRLVAALKAKIRWASPRLAKIILPYRAIRIFEFRLHNALQDLQANSGLIASLHARIGVLQHEAGQSQERVAALEQEKGALAVDLSMLGQENGTLAADLAALGHENLTQRAKISRLEDNRAALSVAAAESHQAKTALLAELARSERQKSTLSATLLDLERDKAALNASVLRLEQDKVSASSLVAALNQDKVALSISVAGFERDNRELNDKVDGLAQQQDGFIARIADLDRDKAALNSRLQELEREKAVLGASLAGLEEIKATLGATIANLEQDKVDFRSQIASLEEIRASMGAVIASLEHDKTDLRKHVVALESDKLELGGQIASLDQDKQALLVKISGMDGEKAESLVRVSDLERDKSDLEVKVLTLEQDKSDMGLRISALGNEKAELKLHVNDLLQNNSGLKAKLDSLVQQIGALTHDVHVLSNEKFILQQETRWGKMPINEIAGVLNWPEVLNDFERTNGFTDFVRLLGLFSGDTKPANKPSTCWDLLSIKNYDQLLTFGYNNFKRTIGNNYFNFLVQKGDPQIQALEKLLPGKTLDRCRNEAATLADDADFPGQDQASYKYFVLLLWEYARTIDAGKYTSVLSEPLEGNPIVISSRGQRFSQDLANSLIEYYSIRESLDFAEVKNVLEIGGGYGRDAFVMLHLNPDIRVTMVDIPPASYLAQRYLSSVFKDRRVFRAREFSRYADVKDELEAASIVFLLPHQLALMPKHSFDLSMNISSFGEMDAKQVKWYFKQLERVTGGHFYFKQWHTSNNIFDGVVFEQGDYPYPKTWTQLYSRPCSVQREFFEAMYKASKS
jgi:putative sugar O-methyltransferase